MSYLSNCSRLNPHYFIRVDGMIVGVNPYESEYLDDDEENADDETTEGES